MLKIVIYSDHEEKKRVGCFYIPDNVNEEWLKKNAPELLHAAQLMAEDYEKRATSDYSSATPSPSLN